MVTGEPVALTAALEAASCEADRIAVFGLEMQDTLSAMLRGSACGAELQTLDTLVQHAQGLCSYLADLARMCPAAWRVETDKAASQLFLGAQRDRLALAPCMIADIAVPGICELF